LKRIITIIVTVICCWQPYLSIADTGWYGTSELGYASRSKIWQRLVEQLQNARPTRENEGIPEARSFLYSRSYELADKRDAIEYISFGADPSGYMGFTYLATHGFSCLVQSPVPIPLHTSRQTLMNQQLSDFGSMPTPDGVNEQNQQLTRVVLLRRPDSSGVCV
jgi:hypothetical protein